jgi:nitrogen-specific signal transduction histidine kinase
MADWLQSYGVELLMALDEQHRVVACNPSARRVLGASVDGRSMSELGRGFGELSSLCVRARASGRDHRVYDLTLDVDGRARAGRALLQPLEPPVEGAVMVVALWLDPARADRAETEDDRRQARLMHHVAAGLAHEIRNPLAAMRGAAQLLQRRLNGAQPELLGLLITESDRVEGIVSELMDVARPRWLRPAPLDLSVLAHRRSKNARAWPEAGEVTLELRLDPSLPAVEGDEEILGRALDNLLRNALQWAGPRGRVLVETGLELSGRLIEGQRDRGRQVWLRVSDSGPGVPKELLGSLFDPLVSGREGGTGLGLYTVRRAISEHGGSIELGECDEGGASFRVCLRERLPQAGEEVSP